MFTASDDLLATPNLDGESRLLLHLVKLWLVLKGWKTMLNDSDQQHLVPKCMHWTAKTCRSSPGRQKHFLSEAREVTPCFSGPSSIPWKEFWRTPLQPSCPCWHTPLPLHSLPGKKVSLRTSKQLRAFRVGLSIEEQESYQTPTEIGSCLRDFYWTHVTQFAQTHKLKRRTTVGLSEGLLRPHPNQGLSGVALNANQSLLPRWVCFLFEVSEETNFNFRKLKWLKHTLKLPSYPAIQSQHSSNVCPRTPHHGRVLRKCRRSNPHSTGHAVRCLSRPSVPTGLFRKTSRDPTVRRR